MAVVLLAALAAFDNYGGGSLSGITGAQTATKQDACIDSDGGKFPDLPGEVHVVYRSAGTSTFSDKCLSDRFVNEWYCENNQLKVESIACLPLKECRILYGLGYCATNAGLATPNINKLALKANSFAVIALGAAFGSYYDAGMSTCKPDNFFLASWVYAPTTEYDEETGEQYESAYQNVMLFDVDSDSKLAVKPKGHDYALRRLKFSEKGLATFNWSEAAGAWILNEGPECTLALAYSPEEMWENAQTEYALPRLANGINFVSVVPQMIGKSLEHVKGDCDLTGAYSNFGHSVPSASDALTKRSWDWWTPKHTFAQNELGLGMWLYSDNTCRLNYG